MGELTVRRNRGFTIPQYQSVGKTEKQSSAPQSQRAGSPGFTVSATLQQLMDRVSQADSRTRESRRTLQAGESVLTEVKDALDRIADLAKRSAGGQADSAALQAELEALRADIDRMIGSAAAGNTPLFLDGGAASADELETLLYAVMGEISGKQEAALPDWLVQGIGRSIPSADQLLNALGLDSTATGAELLAALQNHPLDSSSAAAALATLYLGMTISGGDSPQDALAGIQQLLDKLAGGVPLDQAIEQLTGGEFTSLADFEAQFSDGTAPGLQDFLTGLLLADSGSLLSPAAPMLSLLAGLEGINLELLMGLLTVSQSSEAGLELAQADSADPAAAPPSPPSVMRLEQVQVTGQDLSGVSFQAETQTLTISGTADVTVQGAAPGTARGTEGLTVLVAGSGTVTLQNVDASRVAVEAPAARLFSAGVNLLAEVQLQEGTTLTLGGTGLFKLGSLLAGPSNTLRLTGGAVVVAEREGETAQTLTAPLVLDGPASLAAQASSVSDGNGRSLDPADLVWKTLLPGWSGITSISADGKQARLALLNGDPVRLWLDRGDPSHGHPVHTVLLRGKDASGRLQSRYAYLRWNQYAGAFEAFSMYPNPFTITGGEAGRDWIYEEESHTLRILSSQVTAISGGSGTDTNQTPFSGRIALADRIGGLALTLGGVVCRVSSGRAFDLGRENDVTLILESGTSNLFESGSGFAGISLGDGTSLSIDCADPQGGGALIATGSTGGAGIGRDSGRSRDRISQIWIRGGDITATGAGGGAGIGAGKHGAMGSITILGGMVTSTGGKGGGAGIGAALGAPVGDISIHGGSVTAVATYHAAAIGAGVQGECGDILITGTARIVKALGGNPGADIGACLFGSCGKVLVSGQADIGSAKLSAQAGIPLQMGEDTVILPQFRLSSGALGLDTMSLTTPEAARSARAVLDADRRWVSQIQGVYNTLRDQLEQSAFYNVRQYTGPVRDTATASTLLESTRQSILLQASQALRTHNRRAMEDIQHLLQ